MPRKVVTISFSLPRPIADKLEELSTAAGISRSSYLTMLLTATLDRPFLISAVERESRAIQEQHGYTFRDYNRRGV